MNSLSVNPPGLVITTVAWPEDNSLSVGVLVLVNIETDSSMVSEVVLSSWPVGNLLVWLVSPLSDDSPVVWSVLVSRSVGDGIVSSVPGSDGSSSAIEGPPLIQVPWLMVLDLKLVLMTSNVVVPRESS